MFGCKAIDAIKDHIFVDAAIVDIVDRHDRRPHLVWAQSHRCQQRPHALGAAIAAIVDAVLAANPDQLAQFRAGKDKLKGFFVGAVLRESGGRANPALANEILMSKLQGE